MWVLRLSTCVWLLVSCMLHLSSRRMRELVRAFDMSPSWKCIVASKLVATYAIVAREFNRKAILDRRKRIEGDVLSFDASRVSCCDLYNFSLESHGRLQVPNVQILSDDGDPTKGASTRKLFLGVAHTLLQIMPYASLAPWKCGDFAKIGRGLTRHKHYSGFRYYTDESTKTSASARSCDRQLIQTDIRKTARQAAIRTDTRYHRQIVRHTEAAKQTNKKQTDTQ